MGNEEGTSTGTDILPLSKGCPSGLFSTSQLTQPTQPIPQHPLPASHAGMLVPMSTRHKDQGAL